MSSDAKKRNAGGWHLTRWASAADSGKVGNYVDPLLPKGIPLPAVYWADREKTTVAAATTSCQNAACGSWVMDRRLAVPTGGGCEWRTECVTTYTIARATPSEH